MKSLLIFAAVSVAAGGYLLLRPAPRTDAVAAADVKPAEGTRRVRAVGQLGPGSGTIVIDLEAPKGGKLTEGAPLSVRGSGEHIRVTSIKHALKPAKLPIRVPVEVADGAAGPVELQIAFYWCRDDDKGGTAACSPEKGRVVVDLDLTGDAAGGEAYFRYQAR
jgi:hypothetical protein